MSPKVCVTRIETFSAAHRLYSPELSEEANEKVYGKCSRPNGHGHNYKVEVTIHGPVNDQTGMVMDLVELKETIWNEALNQLDHYNLDRDVEYFRSRPSTTENLAVFIWDRLVAKLPNLLYSVKIHETDKNVVEYKG